MNILKMIGKLIGLTSQLFSLRQRSINLCQKYSSDPDIISFHTDLDAFFVELEELKH